MNVHCLFIKDRLTGTQELTFLNHDFSVYKDNKIVNEKKTMNHLTGVVLVFPRCIYDEIQNVNMS